MRFVEALKLRSKLFLLFLIITIGLVGVGIMGTININSMKKNLDSLYFGSLVPVTELNEILQAYHGNIASTIYQAKNSEMSPSEVVLLLETSLSKIDKKWESYEKHFKRDDEIPYTEYVGLEIKTINGYFYEIPQGIKSGKDLTTISTISVDKQISHIDAIVQKLITYEVGVAKFERKRFLQLYDFTIMQVGMTLLVIILVVLLISYNVFASIQKDHTVLENTTKKLRQANKKLETISYTDSLTSLHNIRYFNLICDKELKRAKRERSYITFMMMDIDFFKQYNDTYGHIEGNYALKAVAKALKDTLHRPSDYIFRLGGEEFGVLLTQTDEENSAILAQALCDAVRGRMIKHEASKVHEYLTISIGVVSCIADEALREDLFISYADKMLYEAKEAGRNRYVIDTNITETTLLVQTEEKVEVVSA